MRTFLRTVACPPLAVADLRKLFSCLRPFAFLYVLSDPTSSPLKTHNH